MRPDDALAVAAKVNAVVARSHAKLRVVGGWQYKLEKISRIIGEVAPYGLRACPSTGCIRPIIRTGPRGPWPEYCSGCLVMLDKLRKQSERARERERSRRPPVYQGFTARQRCWIESRIQRRLTPREVAFFAARLSPEGIAFADERFQACREVMEERRYGSRTGALDVPYGNDNHGDEKVESKWLGTWKEIDKEWQQANTWRPSNLPKNRGMPKLDGDAEERCVGAWSPITGDSGETVVGAPKVGGRRITALIEVNKLMREIEQRTKEPPKTRARPLGPPRLRRAGDQAEGGGPVRLPGPEAPIQL
jgi:hypothetical protein